MAKLVKVTYEGKAAGCEHAQLRAWTVDISNCSVSNQADSSTHFSVLDPWVTGWNNSKKKPKAFIKIVFCITLEITI